MGGGEPGSPGRSGGDPVDVSIVMPCLNESRSLPGCLANARAALDIMGAQLGLSGEIVVADNGSTDGSRELAGAHGARVVRVAQPGYGAALTGGAEAARGRYIVMGDADGSYDFRDAAAMVEALMKGADLCLGSRFKGEIKPGAMPWKNRYIGNPVLTGILNLLFRTGVSDAHCGLRAITQACFGRLRMASTGMEFASEMVIKAALTGSRIAEVPATLSPDTRGRRPHLRPWRDGWRHLRYLLMLSPAWLFVAPAAILGACGLSILAFAAHTVLTGSALRTPIGNYWVVLAGAMLGIAHIGGLLGAATSIYGVREGYRRPSAWTGFFARWVSLETMLLTGIGSAGLGFACLFGVAAYWSSLGFHPIASVLPAVVGTTFLVLGSQTVLGGFLLAILSGNEARFLLSPARSAAPPHASVLPRDNVHARSS